MAPPMRESKMEAVHSLASVSNESNAIVEIIIPSDAV